jgi:hypothetical protein
MTIDEAIKICEEDAEKIGGNPQSDRHAERCRQLAEWLTELKEAKRLLKMAVEDINSYVDCVDCYEAHCDECCCSQDNHCHWKHEAEALKLIGEDEDENS